MKISRIARRHHFVNQKTIFAYGMIAPAMIWIFGTFAYSVIYNLYLSFFKVGVTGPENRKFIFLSNYVELFSSNEFWHITRNTVIWVLSITILLELIALITAILLNTNIVGRGIYRTILLLPWVIPGVVTGILWKYMFDTKYGVINDIFFRFHIINSNVNWLAQSSTSLISVIVAYIWKVFPFSMILLLGSLQTIPIDIYEAAEIEGAGSIKKIFYVTLPLLKDSIITTTIITAITAFNSYDLTYIMTGGGPIYSSEILGKYVYNLGFLKFDFGSASATGTIMFFASLCMILIYALRQNKKEAN